MKIWTILIFALPLGTSQVADKISELPSVESLEIEPGVLITPFYSASHELCKISIEKRHYFSNKVDIDAVMPKEQILSLFDRLVPSDDRGQPRWHQSRAEELTEVDGGTRTTQVLYENVSLAMYGKEEGTAYVAAVVTWNRRKCKAD